MNNTISLAVKYRPNCFADVVEQESTKRILQNQLKSNNIRNAYLFCGPAGDGKTTTARIFAKEINNGVGNPIELDAASNNSVDDIRRINQQAQTQALDSEYKIFILDEVHALSNSAWQAMLKLIEEPPAKTVFIFCTTDPQKIPKTILSRVQRYNFQRITYQGIFERLKYVCEKENLQNIDENGLQFIAKTATGCMRDALTYLDKALAFDKNLSVESVAEALGIVSYSTLFEITDLFICKNIKELIEYIENLYIKGIDLKSFIKSWLLFTLDCKKYIITRKFNYVQIPDTYKDKLELFVDKENVISDLLDILVELNTNIKWEVEPKALIECRFILEDER